MAIKIRLCPWDSVYRCFKGQSARAGKWAQRFTLVSAVGMHGGKSLRDPVTERRPDVAGMYGFSRIDTDTSWCAAVPASLLLSS